MGVVDFTVLGAVKKIRVLITDLSTPSLPAMPSGGDKLAAFDCRDGAGGNGGFPPRSRSPASPAQDGGAGSDRAAVSPPPLRSGSKRAADLAARRESTPRSLRYCGFRRAEDEEDDEPGVQFFTPGNDFLQDFLDTDSVSVSTVNEMCGFNSATPSPSESPSWAVGQEDSTPTSTRNYPFGHDSPDYARRPIVEPGDPQEQADGCDHHHLSACQNEENKPAQHPFHFDAEIWRPPPPEDEGDDVESGLFGSDDEDDDVGDSGQLFAPSSFSSAKSLGLKETTNGAHKEGLRSAVLGHFRALVAQLLKVEGVSLTNDDGSKSWLEIVSSLSWEAANFVKPDTKKGGSMDPVDYVKFKCVASGHPSDSNFIKGIVCSKNVKHKRMVSQHRNARLLILGGALEYQKVPNKLASINTVLEQEKEHLRAVVGKIESRRPNVLLVEKSVSSYAQELLAKDISLVLNVKRTLLDRISRCTGGQIVSSIDNIPSAKLGQCERFKVEKVMEFSSAKHTNKKSAKTLMFFEGCPRRLGCTVLLRGTCREELKKVKRAAQLAIFAAYHLSLETSFLADEGATLPKVPSRPSIVAPQMHIDADDLFSRPSSLAIPGMFETTEGKHPGTASAKKIFECLSPSLSSSSLNEDTLGVISEHKESDSSFIHMNPRDMFQPSCPIASYNGLGTSPDTLACQSRSSGVVMQYEESYDSSHLLADVDIHQDDVLEKPSMEHRHSENHWNCTSNDDHRTGDLDDQNELPGEYFSGADNHQSILVSLSSTCIPKGLVCERSQLLRIKFYGSFDKPLGRYLCEDLFDKAYSCPSCKEPSEAHVRCYTHQHGSLVISVRRLLSRKLHGERDGRIWMWHRCLKCKLKDGVPPATHRVIMSDAAWGLSFGKFLELSFSNHATANRIASCGHSLQRDCLRFYGYGDMVASFRYSPVDSLSVSLPPSVLDFNFHIPQEWVKSEAVAICSKMECLHTEVSDILHSIEKNVTFSEEEPLKTGIQRHIIEMKDLLKMERNEYEVLLQPVIGENGQAIHATIDILELNRLKRGLLLDAYIWDHRLRYIDSLRKTNNHLSKTDVQKAELVYNDTRLGKSYQETIMTSFTSSGSPRKSLLSREGRSQVNECNSDNLAETDLPIESGSVEGDTGGLDLVFSQFNSQDKGQLIAKATIGTENIDKLPSLASIFSDKIDLAWTGSSELFDLPKGNLETDQIGSFNLMDNPSFRKANFPVRIHSFDSRLRHREHAGLSPTSLRLSSVKSADSLGDLTRLLKDPMPNMRRAYSHRTPIAIEKLNVVLTRTLTYISSTSRMISDGARLLLPQTGLEDDVVVAIYDDEPTSIISYAMTSQEYVQYVTRKSDARFSTSNQSDGMESCSSYGLDGPLSSQENLSDCKGTQFRISFDDETSLPADKAKFSVTFYFAKQFDALRKKCCPRDIDYIRSLSRCKRWSAQGGKSNVYFAKTLDERFIIKQVTKTELDSFEEFAPQYFKYLTESLTSGSPTCLAKIVGLYQVSVKSLKGGREVKMDLMVMENLFFRRKISRVYDLKGSLRSRYNPDTTGNNKVLLDLNLLEALHTKPIFLGSKAKRRLERAVWNDTSFLASVDVMDYSLLVGIDEQKKELVIGIIDFLRQYTWDKQLETWVKASGLLGGPKNTSPTIISPMQYKKRFRKAMSKYFLTVPDQWSS